MKGRKAMQKELAIEKRTVERFKMRTVVFHWIHLIAFLALIVTGLILFIPWFGAVAAGGTTRVIHRIFAVLFIVLPILYFPFNAKESLHFVKESIIGYGKDDIGWALAAPD